MKGRTFKLLRKTSATLLRGHEKYSGLEDLFLGHAPRSMSDRHYASAPNQLLAGALGWLGAQFGLASSAAQSAHSSRATTPAISAKPSGNGKNGSTKK